MIETDSPFLAPVPNRGKKMNHLLLISQLPNLLKSKILKKNLLKKQPNNFNKLFFD